MDPCCFVSMAGARTIAAKGPVSKVNFWKVIFYFSPLRQSYKCESLSRAPAYESYHTALVLSYDMISGMSKAVIHTEASFHR